MLKRVTGSIISMIFAPALAMAACDGQDLRASMTAEENAGIAARMAEVPFAEGNYWIATKGERHIHLIGTVHITSPRLEDITQGLGPIVKTADVLLMESTPSEIAQMQIALSKDPQLTFITKGPSLIDRLPAQDWQILADKARAAGIPTWMAAKMRPWFLATALSIPPCLRSDPNVEYGLDKRLAAIATATTVPLASLEDPMDVIRMLNRAPLEEQLRQMRPYIALIGGGEEDEDNITTMLAAYFDERVAEYLEITRAEFLSGTAAPQDQVERIWTETMEGLLKQRNLAWIPVIESHLGDSIVVAVGALHLSGEYGLLNLLSHEGYSLQRAEF